MLPFAICSGMHLLLLHQRACGRSTICCKNTPITINAVMSVGILSAAATGEVISAALIVFFMLVARYLEGKTTGRARRAIAELAELAPKTARVKREGVEETIAVAALSLGDQVVVRGGEQIPIEGMVLRGQAIVNPAPITC